MMKNMIEEIYWAPQRKLGGGWICFKDAPEAPPPPDYTGAAVQTAAGNLEAARAQTAANRVNQVTPYGSLTYSQKEGYGPDGGWTATQTLSPTQQALLDQQNKTSLGLSSLADRGLGYVDSALSNNITADDLPADMVNPGQTGEEALMARFQPRMDQSRAAMETQLANQGIARGSEAYSNAERDQRQGENDLRMQAALNGINVGQTAQNHQMSLKTALQNQPVNMLNAVRTGAQVTNPTFTSVPQQGMTGGADYAGALANKGKYDMGLYNSDVATTNANNSATASAVGAIGGAAMMMF